MPLLRTKSQMIECSRAIQEQCPLGSPWKAESFLAGPTTYQEPKTDDGLMGTLSQVRDSQVTIISDHLTLDLLILDKSPKFDLLQKQNPIQIKFHQNEIERSEKRYLESDSDK